MIGATFLCDKKRFIEIGMFDEDFFFYWEDVELSNRIKIFKYKIYENQKSQAIHQNGNSSIDGFKTDFIRYENFIFGELLYDYKCKKIRFVKIFRKFLQAICLSILNVILLRFKDANINLSKIVGVIKFIKFILKNK